MSRLQINKCIHCKFKNGIIEGLFAENEELKQGLFTSDVDELKAEIKELKKCSNVAYVEVLNKSNDKLQAENKELKEDNNK